MALQTLSTPALGTNDADADLDAVRKELVAKLTDAELMAKVHRAVEAIAHVPRDSLIAKELVAEAVDDTYRGDLPRDLKTSLYDHLVEEARRQFRRGARKRRSHVSFDVLGDQDMRLVDSASETERRRDVSVLRAQIARVRQLLGPDEDPATLQLLTLWELGVKRRRDVRRLGLSGWKYRAANDRLQELFASLPAMPMPEAEHDGTEQNVSQTAPSDGVIAELTRGQRIGPKRADAGARRSSPGELGARIDASRRLSRKP